MSGNLRCSIKSVKSHNKPPSVKSYNKKTTKISIMGRSEKILIVGFVAFTAGASAFAHYYTMSEGYALKAIKDQERINNTSKEKTTTAAKPKAPTVGGVWGNIAKQRDAIKNSKKQ